MRKKPFLLIICVSLIGPIYLSADDASLEEALRAANSGQTQAAIRKFEALKNKMPGDSRVHQSLGLLYQSIDQRKAIRELETAVRLRATPEAYYALGLLYEAKYISDQKASWQSKASQAWEKVISLTSPGHPNRSTAERHLNRIRN